MAIEARAEFRSEFHEVDFCVVGAGMAGICAAISAARHGATVALMHDRPVLGGNSSSECRVHICGADRHNSIKNMRETGILEELRLENVYRNPNRSFSIWDLVLYEKVLAEPNITLLLNCSCMNATMDDKAIGSVIGWQLTTQTYHHVCAKIFADCSGDAILAPLTGAEHRMGREARDEYGESIAPLEADRHTMGMTCLFQSREYDFPQPFAPPAWAHQFDSCDELPRGRDGHRWWQMGYWWVELGGEHDSIHDTERLRDELLKIMFGVWDHVKNRCPNRDAAKNWALEWIQFLPAKRESRRYIGEHVLTQHDIEAAGPFDDVVAYGGWTMDDHNPAGFHSIKIHAPVNIHHETPSPYGIPYRSLYSQNISNLMFAGRDASCTHAAMSSTRVMGTGCSMGQAVGTAASIAVSKGISPAGMQKYIPQLQQTLLYDDAYLPRVSQCFSNTIMNATLSASQGEAQLVRNGMGRPIGDQCNGWSCQADDWIAYTFKTPVKVMDMTLVLDSGLDQNITLSYHQKDNQLTSPPDVMPKAFRIEGLFEDQWKPLARVEENHQRQCRLPIGQTLKGIRFVLAQTWGAPQTRVYAFYCNE